jgi:hypothetical protein
MGSMKVFLVLLLLAAASSTAISAPAKVTDGSQSSISENAEDARMLLNSMSTRFGSDQGLRYIADISYATGSPLNVLTKTARVYVTIEKQAKMSIKTTDSGALVGVINASGANLTLYDAITGRYLVVPTQPDLGGALSALETCGQAVFPTPSPAESALYISFAFPDLFFSGRFFDLGPYNGISVRYSMSTAKIDGKTYDIANQIISRGNLSRSMSYTIDPTTYMPIQLKQTQTVGTDPATVFLTMNFRWLKPVHSQLAASTYAFAPPSTATLVQPVLPQPAPAIMPSAPTQTPPPTAPPTPGPSNP